MRLLILGGTVFLSRATAERATAAGHDVVCASRGATGSVPDGARHVVWDRSEVGPAPVEEVRALLGEVDAVIDVARHPGRVARAVAAWPEAHWVFVSTVSVYADHAVPGGRPDTTAELPPETDDAADLAEPDTYGAMKVACEQAVRAGAASTAIVRPGLIVGPGDPSGRFSYWPERLATALGDSAEVLCGSDPEAPTQWVDVDDLAAWLVLLAADRTTGTFDAIGEPITRSTFIDGVARGVGGAPRPVWAPSEWLTGQGVEFWAGEDALPMWLDGPEYAGFLARDHRPAADAGLRCRPLAETAHATGEWLRRHPVGAPDPAARTGISRQREAALLTALAPG
ncbi:NAD-dependent epimerase/dehydratase family protein [Nocardioides sp. R-C-SC26]|uniref:NAD-dependent epimerase/dehydratase family protein n=1 Tax=Nocardioides sp. R-C-SC26 TaxID=2870414 RepID=UPI001E637179|nr:NAD-dependent epimerase/dehydratase family protein [Nocardioides sp. R-C-SC26]